MDTGFLAFYLYFFLISASAPIDQSFAADGAAAYAGLWFLFPLHIDIPYTVSYPIFIKKALNPSSSKKPSNMPS